MIRKPLHACLILVLILAKNASCASLPAPTEQTTSLEKVIEEVLMRTYAPLVYFHPGEKYFPCGVGWYTERCSLWKKGEKNSKIKNKGEIGAQQVALLGNYADKNSLYFLKPEVNKGHYRGEPIKNNTCTAPCYAHLLKKPDGGIVIQYCFFYAYNGPTVDLKFISFGVHRGDWEHIDVHLNKDYSIKEVYLAAHRPALAGGFISPKKMRWHERTHPIIFASRFGHASHPTIMKFPDKNLDVTGKGVKWDTQHYLVNIDTPEQAWINFRGHWGDSKEKKFLGQDQQGGSPKTPKYQAWWRNYNKDGQLIERTQNGPVKIIVDSRAHKKNKTKHALARVSSLWGLSKQTKKPHHSKIFDLDGKIPTRSKKMRVSIKSTQPTTPSSPELISFSIFQEKPVQSDRFIYKGISTDSVITRPKFDSTRKDRDKSLKNLYITDIVMKNGNKDNAQFEVSFQPLEE